MSEPSRWQPLPGARPTLRQRLSATERDLQDSLTRLKLAMQSTGIGLWDYRPGQERVGSNEEVARMLGHAPETFSETRAAFVERLHPEDRAFVRARFRDYLGGLRADYRCEFRMRTRSGAYRWFRSVGQIVERDAAGAPLRVVGTYLDITEQIEAMQRLEELSARLIAVQEEERRHLARELHDEFGQQLTAIKFNLHGLGREFVSEAARERLADCRTSVDRTLEAIRDRALDLRPPMLDDLGLVPALEWYCRQQQQRSGVRIVLVVPRDPGRLPEALETAGFRVVQEAVNNALRHGAPKRIDVRIEPGPDHLELHVRDDGIGFEPSPGGLRGFGLDAMKERVALVGGTFSLRSAPGKGTQIRVRLPQEGAER